MINNKEFRVEYSNYHWSIVNIESGREVGSVTSDSKGWFFTQGYGYSTFKYYVNKEEFSAGDLPKPNRFEREVASFESGFLYLTSWLANNGWGSKMMKLEMTDGFEL